MAINRDIQVSLHGKRFGITPDNNLVIDGHFALAAGDSPMQRVVWADDFQGALLSNAYVLTEGTDSATSDFAINAQKNGVARITTGDSATHTMAANGVQVDFGELTWYAGNGGLTIETRVKLDVVTTVAFFFGFTDQVASLELPWSISGTTFTSNQTDGVGFIFDTAATTDDIYAVGVKADTDITPIDYGAGYVAATWIRLRVTVDNAGHAKFYINGVLIGQADNAVTTTVALSPVFAAYSAATSAVNIDVDYLWVAQDRA